MIGMKKIIPCIRHNDLNEIRLFTRMISWNFVRFVEVN